MRVKAYVRSLIGIEVADSAVVGEKVATCEHLRRKVNVPVVLEEPIVFELVQVWKSEGLGW